MKIFKVKRNSQGEYEVHVEEEITDLIITIIKAGQAAEDARKKPE